MRRSKLPEGCPVHFVAPEPAECPSCAYHVARAAAKAKRHRSRSRGVAGLAGALALILAVGCGGGESAIEQWSGEYALVWTCSSPPPCEDTPQTISNRATIAASEVKPEEWILITFHYVDDMGGMGSTGLTGLPADDAWELQADGFGWDQAVLLITPTETGFVLDGTASGATATGSVWHLEATRTN